MSVAAGNQLNTSISFDQVRECLVQEISSQCEEKGWVFRGKTPLDATAICLYQANRLQAVIVVMRANACYFKELSRLPDEALRNTLFIDSIWIDANAIVNKIIPLILYFALRRGRIWGLENIATLIPKPNTQIPLATFLNLEPLKKIPEFNIDNQIKIGMAQRLAYSGVKIYEKISEEDQKILPQYFVGEIIETFNHWLNQFYQGSWARSILEETISKEQYICSLLNMHQFVKYTTRLCARCVAHSSDIVLRNHYINHLKGEINHELMIEKDLQALGGDVDYLLHQHIPMIEINEFLSIQESIIGYKQDPVLMLACPLVAEGITAFMRKDFIQHLYNIVSGWGIQPETATKFLTSHMHTDGGEDGHWQLVVNMLQQKILDEVRLQQFLCMMRTAMNGFARGFNATIDNLKLWEVVPLNAGPN